MINIAYYIMRTLLTAYNERVGNLKIIKKCVFQYSLSFLKTIFQSEVTIQKYFILPFDVHHKVHVVSAFYYVLKFLKYVDVNVLHLNNYELVI
jgi:hypothetical protein